MISKIAAKIQNNGKFIMFGVDFACLVTAVLMIREGWATQTPQVMLAAFGVIMAYGVKAICEKIVHEYETNTYQDFLKIQESSNVSILGYMIEFSKWFGFALILMALFSMGGSDVVHQNPNVVILMFTAWCLAYISMPYSVAKLEKIVNSETESMVKRQMKSIA